MAKTRHRKKRSTAPWVVGLVALLAVAAGVLTVAALRPVPEPTGVADYTPAPAPTTDPRPYVAFIGDSYTVGTGATSAGASYADVVAREMKWTAYRIGDVGSGYVLPGKNGQTERDLIASADLRRSSAVILATGYNDGNPDRVDYRGLVMSAISDVRAKNPTAQIVLVGPWAPKGSYTSSPAEVSRILSEVAASEGAVFISPESWLTDPSLIASDGIHPNDAGHQAIGVAMAGALRDAGVTLYPAP